VIDTFAWIEYFAGSKQGEKAKAYIDGGEAITPTIVIAEFADKYAREKMIPTERLKFIRTKSTLAVLDDEIAEMAGALSAERRATMKGWGMADSIVLATARVRGVKVVTGDEHFKGLNEAIMIDERANQDLSEEEA
jgi:predicted nucleic acid-binding protein